MSVKFIYKREDFHKEFSAVSDIEMCVDSEASLDEMLTAYREFLLSIGYLIPGELVVNDVTD